MVVREASVMQEVGARVVHSRVTKYHSCLVDLRWCHAIHSCDSCTLRGRPTLCPAIHYGQCSAVKFTPVNVANGPRGRAVRIVTKSIKQARERAVRGGEEARGVPDGEAPPARAANRAAEKEAPEPAKEPTPPAEAAAPPSAAPTTTTPSPTPSTTTASDEHFLKAKQEALRKKREREKAEPPPPADSLAKTVAKGGSGDSAAPARTNQSKKKGVHIPQFYFPHGQPGKEEGENVYKNIKEAYLRFENGPATKANMPALCKAVGVPLYWKMPLFVYAGGEKNGHITLQCFLAAWRKLTSHCHDDPAKFVRLCAKPGTSVLEEDDFIPLVQDIVETHPGLSFLQDAPEFHSRYVQTVISRVFYCVNRSWSGRITAAELRRSNFLQTMRLLEEEDDVNQIMDFFSYEHFYVIYCKFWELDKDHDLYISSEDLARHNDHAICMRMIERIFSGAVTRHLKDNKMSYKDFVWFLISEEDKRHPTSIEYWFRCMDLDGDGAVSMYEMEYFYEEQVQKMEALGIDTLPFEDCLCQMLDMLKPARGDSVTLSDLKACKLTPIFFDTFFNLDKYLEHEQKDPFANVRDHDSDEPEPTDWERYAAEEYEILVAEEGANGMNEEILYEDDFEPEEDKANPATTEKEKEEPAAKSSSKQRPKAKTTDDIYDFTNSKDQGF